jgi:hypothetical protein
MRPWKVLLPSLLFAGCHATVPPKPFVVAAVVDTASIAVFQRDVLDLVWSLVSGRDCSIVHLEQNQPYCRPIEPLPGEPPYCTRSLGVPDCWVSREVLINPPPSLADTPPMTATQIAHQYGRWP